LIITFDGAIATNQQYINSKTSHLILSHTAVADSLLLSEYDDRPYEYYSSGWTKSAGRSQLGAIRLNGNNWKKDVWECNFHATQAQADLFDLLLQAQQNSTPIIITDHWKTTLVTRQIWVDVDQRYKTAVATNEWYRLQFQALEV
jgi:hypothetical protein